MSFYRNRCNRCYTKHIRDNTNRIYLLNYADKERAFACVLAYVCTKGRMFVRSRGFAYVDGHVAMMLIKNKKLNYENL